MTMNAQLGCQWVEETLRRWNYKSKRYDTIPIHCLKITDGDSTLCPKHILMEQERKTRQAERERAAKSPVKVKEKSYY